MLRLKRTVRAAFADRAVVLPGNVAGAKRPREEEEPLGDSMARLDAEAAGTESGGFVSAGLVDNWSIASGSGGGDARGDGGGPAFTPSATFGGARPGYVFKKGTQGVGYYRDGPTAGGDGVDGNGGAGGGEEIDIDDDDEEELEQRAVPAEVFGSAGLGASVGDRRSEPMGALERMRRKQSGAS